MENTPRPYTYNGRYFATQRRMVAAIARDLVARFDPTADSTVDAVADFAGRLVRYHSDGAAAWSELDYNAAAHHASAEAAAAARRIGCDGYTVAQAARAAFLAA